MGLWKIPTRHGGERRAYTLFMVEHPPKDPEERRKFELRRLDEQRAKLSGASPETK